MSIKLEVRDTLPERAVVFENPSFDGSIIGVSLNGGAIYSYERMAEEFAEENDCEVIEAIEFIEYNTMRALAYFPDPKPIIVSEMDRMDE